MAAVPQVVMDSIPPNQAEAFLEELKGQYGMTGIPSPSSLAQSIGAAGKIDLNIQGAGITANVHYDSAAQVLTIDTFTAPLYVAPDTIVQSYDAVMADVQAGLAQAQAQPSTQPAKQ